MQRHHPDIWLHLAAILLGLLFTSPATMAGEVSQVNPIAIGTIDLHPAGDTVIIDAQSGPASPQVNRSLVTGGSSGLITLTSADAEHVDIIYPSSVVLSDGSHNLTFTNIPSYSEYDTGGVDLPGGNVSVDVSVGGKLVLPGDTILGSYSGSMNIVLNFS